MLFRLKGWEGGFNSDYECYLTFDARKQEDLVNLLREELGKLLAAEVVTLGLKGLSIDDHIPDEGVIRFILEQYSYYCLKQNSKRSKVE